MTMETIDTAVIGGGPAGLMAALTAASRVGTNPAGQESIVVFEKGPRPGRKLLASGSGRCNLTHEGTVADFLGRYGGGERPPGPVAADGSRSPGSAGRFLRKALYDFDNVALRTWLADRGLATEADANGKVFPGSGRAMDVLSLLVREVEAAGAVISVSNGVKQLARSDDGTGFELTTVLGVRRARAVILAAGGHSYPALGSDGDSWRLAAGLGHTIIEPGPALAPVYVSPFPYAVCAGISLPGSSLVIRRSGRVVARGSGAVLFTHSGLSGPGILDSSRWMRQGDEVLLPLGPFTRADEANAALQALCTSKPARQLGSMLADFMPKRLAEVLLGLAACPGETRAAQLTKACRQRLAAGLAGEVFVVQRLGDLDEAMASRGGVSLEEVDPKTMMSRLVPGLYFAGEALDVDGDTGGYNLQAAFSSGRLAGLSAVESAVTSAAAGLSTVTAAVDDLSAVANGTAGRLAT
jgi:predicted Rossmann fold flavoprotein